MFTEDLEPFFDDFGIEVTFTRDDVLVVTSTLILDSVLTTDLVHNRSFYDKEFYEAKVTGSSVMLYGIETALAALELNDIATVNTVEWFVIGIEPDTAGMVTIQLSANQV